MEKRILKDFNDFQSSRPEGTQLYSVNGDIRYYIAEFKGPEGTPYEGGIFTFEIYLPGPRDGKRGYPFVPPVCHFLTKIYHPNIDEFGYICVNILKDEWKPSNTLSQVVLIIQNLLANPNFDDARSSNAAEYREDPDRYNATAREWTKKYAKRLELPF